MLSKQSVPMHSGTGVTVQYQAHATPLLACACSPTTQIRYNGLHDNTTQNLPSRVQAVVVNIKSDPPRRRPIIKTTPKPDLLVKPITQCCQYLCCRQLCLYTIPTTSNWQQPKQTMLWIANSPTMYEVVANQQHFLAAPQTRLSANHTCPSCSSLSVCQRAAIAFLGRPQDCPPSHIAAAAMCVNHPECKRNQ